MFGRWKYGLLLLAGLFAAFYIYRRYRVAPALQCVTVMKPDGSRENIKKYLDRPTVISFAASWCGPCRKELTEMGRVSQEITAVAKVLVISDEDFGGVNLLRVPGSEDFDFLRLDGRFSDLSIHSIPTTYLLDADGRIVKKHTGYLDWSDPSARAHMLALITNNN